MDEYMAALDIIAKTNHIPEKEALVAPESSCPVVVTHEKANNMTNVETVDEPAE